MVQLNDLHDNILRLVTSKMSKKNKASLRTTAKKYNSMAGALNFIESETRKYKKKHPNAPTRQIAEFRLARSMLPNNHIPIRYRHQDGTQSFFKRGTQSIPIGRPIGKGTRSKDKVLKLPIHYIRRGANIAMSVPSNNLTSEKLRNKIELELSLPHKILNPFMPAIQKRYLKKVRQKQMQNKSSPF